MRNRLCRWLAATALAAPGCGGGAVTLPALSATDAPVRERILARHRAVVEQPSAETWQAYAYALDAHGFRAEAEPAYLRAAALDDQRAFDMLHLCGVATRFLDPERAIAHFRRALALRDDVESTHLHLAVLLVRTGQLDEARQRYERILTRWQSAHAELGLGRVLLATGDAPGALPHLETARNQDPNLAAVHEALARAYARLGRSADSKAAAAKAGDLANENWFPDPLQHRLEQEEVHSGAHFRRGSSLAEQGKVKEAIAELEKGVALQPDYATSRFYLASLLAQDAQLDAAIAHLDRILARDGRHKTALELRARCRLTQGKRAEADADLRALLRIDPRHAWALQQVGR
jgi:tetratricopeptide (TPR) repeat protein